MAGPGSYIIGEEEKKALLEVVEAGYLFRYGDKKDPQFLAKGLAHIDVDDLIIRAIEEGGFPA